jgi:hypothetical protein
MIRLTSNPAKETEMTDDTTSDQPTLQTLAQKLQAMRQRPWVEFTDIEQMRWDLSLDLLLGLADAVIALQAGSDSASQAVTVANLPTSEQLREVIAPLVAESISAAFGKLESATAPVGAPPSVTSDQTSTTNT